MLAFAVLGALAGIVAHFWRAHATMFPEDLGLGEPLDTLTRDDYQWEKHVVGAEWDDAGYWDPGSVRNLVYYMASGAARRCSWAPCSGAQRDECRQARLPTLGGHRAELAALFLDRTDC